MQKEFTDKHFIKQLQTFNIDSVSVKIQRRVHEYLERPNFNENYMRSKSGAAGDLCAWVIAVNNYARLVNKDSMMKAIYLGEQKEALKNEIHDLVNEYVALAEDIAKAQL